MSAEVVNALNAHADDLDNEAEATEANPVQPVPGSAGAADQAGQAAQRHPNLLRTLAAEFRSLAWRIQGHDPSAAPEPAPLDTTQAGTVTQTDSQNLADGTRDDGAPAQ